MERDYKQNFNQKIKEEEKKTNILNSVVRSLTVGNTLSFALNDTNNANGTIHKHIVK